MAISLIDFTGNPEREACVAKKLNMSFYNNGKGEMIALVAGSQVKILFWENTDDENILEQLRNKSVDEIDTFLSGSRKTFAHSKGSFEKCFIKLLHNEKFLKIWVDNAGNFILFFEQNENGNLDLKFVEEKDFDQEKFLKSSEERRNTRIKAEQEAENAKIQAQKEAEEAARKEKASKVVVPTGISKIGEQPIPSSGPRVIGTPRPKADLTKTDSREETFRPFAQLKDKLDIGEVTGKNSTVHKKIPRGSRPDFNKPTKGENIGLEQEFRQNMAGVEDKTEAEPIAALA